MQVFGNLGFILVSFLHVVRHSVGECVLRCTNDFSLESKRGQKKLTAEKEERSSDQVKPTFTLRSAWLRHTNKFYFMLSYNVMLRCVTLRYVTCNIKGLFSVIFSISFYIATTVLILPDLCRLNNTIHRTKSEIYQV